MLAKLPGYKTNIDMISHYTVLTPQIEELFQIRKSQIRRSVLHKTCLKVLLMSVQREKSRSKQSAGECSHATQEQCQVHAGNEKPKQEAV